MKAPSTKPVSSSPGRTPENLYHPPPLTRFLRSHVRGRSRGRPSSYRSSPLMLVNNKNTIQLQEPSSPKVTCMGQVRVKQRPIPSPDPTRPGCSCIKWAYFLHTRKENPRAEDTQQKNIEEGGEGRVRACVSKSNIWSPSRNALLLTRCSSAPYKSSSLAYKFWGSPSTEETEQEEASDNPIRESIDKEGHIDLSRHGNGVSKNFEVEELGRKEEGEGDGTLRPLFLTRSKSEPARTDKKFDPEMGFWKKNGRLGFT